MTAMAKGTFANIRINTVDLCYDNKEYKYDVAEVETFGWEMIGYGLMYLVLKNDTPYSLKDCETDVYVKFRAPRENESQDSMVSMVYVSSTAPNGMVIHRSAEYDADRLSFALPKGVRWGRKSEIEQSQEI